MTMINAADMMATKINELNAFAKAKSWNRISADGQKMVVRVYLEKGFIELRDGEKANIEAVGRNYFEAAKSALVAVGYTRVYA